MKDLVNDWNNQLVLLSPIAEIQPPGGYLTFVSSFKSNLNYFMGTIVDTGRHSQKQISSSNNSEPIYTNDI